MPSTPPAIIMSASPSFTARAAWPAASSPEPHRAIDGRTGDLDRQTPAEQARHARHVAVVLAGLVDATIDDVVHRAPVDIGIALHQRLDGMGRQVVDPHGAQAAIVAADGVRMASQMKASVILGYSRHNDYACPVSTGRRACQCPSAVRDLAGETAADGVLGVTPKRPLENGQRSGAQAEQRELDSSASRGVTWNSRSHPRRPSRNQAGSRSCPPKSTTCNSPPGATPA